MRSGWKSPVVMLAVLCGLFLMIQPVAADMVAPEQGLENELKAEAEPIAQEQAAPSIRPKDGNRIEPPPPKDREPRDCIRGGCSGELCVDASKGGVASTCMWSPEFECYAKVGVCERQADGQCGWTQSTTLKNCLRDKRMGGPR